MPEGHPILHDRSYQRETITPVSGIHTTDADESFLNLTGGGYTVTLHTPAGAETAVMTLRHEGTSAITVANSALTTIEPKQVVDLAYSGGTWAITRVTTDEVGIVNLDEDTQSMLDTFIGMALDSPVVDVTSNGTAVTLTLENSGGGDIRFVFSDGVHTHDCTPAASLVLTPGTDAAANHHHVYIDQSDKTLKTQIGSWPATEHAPVALVLVQSAATAQTGGLRKVHAWTDHAKSANGGHLKHLNYYIRRQHATYESGVAPTITDGVATFDIATTAGVALQLHDHVYPAFDTGVSSEIEVVNHPTTPNVRAAGMAGQLTDALGGSMSNNYYNIVFYGVVSEDPEDCQLCALLPTGSYNNLSDALADNAQQSVYTMLADAKGCAFLIARVTMQHQSGSNTFTEHNTTELLGLTPSTAAGTSAGALADGSVTNAKLADMVQATVKGRAAGAGTGAPVDLTGSQVLAIVGITDVGSGIIISALERTAIGDNTTHRGSDGKDHSDVVLNNTHRGSDGKDHSDVVLNNTHRGSSGTDHANVALNDTHRASDGKDHSDVVLNNTHRASDGKDHSDVVLNNTHRGSDGKDHSDVVLNNTHRSSDGKDHSDVVLNNTHRSSDGKDHSDVVLNNTHRGAAHAPAGAEATTFEALNGNSDVGTGSDQVAQGDHTHPAGDGDPHPIKYEWKTGTGATDPDIGYFKLNNAVALSATAMFLRNAPKNTDTSWGDDLIKHLRYGDTILVYKDASNWVRYGVNGPLVDNSTWWNIPVIIRESAGTISVTDVLDFSYVMLPTNKAPHDGGWAISDVGDTIVRVTSMAYITLYDGYGKSVKFSGISILDANITVAGAGGLDTGTEAANTWYYIWAISNGLNMKLILSVNSVTPTMPTGYTYKRRVGAVRNDASSNFIPFVQRDRYVKFKEEYIISAGGLTTAAWTALNVSAFFPTNVCNKVSIHSDWQSLIGISARSDGEGAELHTHGDASASNFGGIFTDTRSRRSILNVQLTDSFSSVYYFCDNANGNLIASGFELENI